MSDSSVRCNLCNGNRVRECYSRTDGNSSTYSPRLKVWKYLWDRSKTSTSAETILRNSYSDQHLLETLTIKNTSPRFNREQALWRAINKHTIAIHKMLDYYDVLFVSIRDRWHSHVWMSNVVFHKRSQRRYYNENTEQNRASATIARHWKIKDLP